MKFYRPCLFALLIAFTLSRCTPRNHVTRSYISAELKNRSGLDLAETKQPGQVQLPANVVTTDGMNEDEAIAIALWNNAQFQSDLASMAIANADVIDAWIVAHPLLRYYRPLPGLWFPDISILRSIFCG